ncbi:MAG: diacylglycerol kinase family protein, partial [Thermodesulfovibrionales bacterium]
SKGFDVDIRLTQYKGHAEEIAKEIAQSGGSKEHEQLIISAGGDGTYNEVANGLVSSTIPMAILPMGTTSVLAIELDIPKDIEEAVQSILNGVVIQINTGVINFFKNGQEFRRHFLLMAGIGYDAETVKGVDTGYKKTVGKLAYIISGLKTFLRKSNHSIIATIGNEDGIHTTVKCSNIIIGKGAHYGGYFRVTPHASLINPYFYCFLTHGTSRSALLRYVVGIITHRHLRLPDIEYMKGYQISLDGNAPIQIDGDYIGELPAKITLGEKTLRFVVNSNFIGQKINLH